MDVTILGDDRSKTFYWPDALPAAKPPMELPITITRVGNGVDEEI